MCVAQKLEPKIAAENVKSVLEDLEVEETSNWGGWSFGCADLMVKCWFWNFSLPVVIIS